MTDVTDSVILGGMKLLEYFQAHGGKGTPSCPVLIATAKKAGCSKTTLYMIALGHKPAGPALAYALEHATDGKVTRQELRADYFGPAKKRVA